MAGDADKRKVVLYGTVAVVGVSLVVLAAVGLGRARVSGGTPDEQMASINRLADERPRGAADAIAAIAADGYADPRVRQTALVALGRFVREQDRGVIDGAVEDENPLVRAGAAGTLGMYGDARAAETLGLLVARDTEPKVRLAAVLGLGRAGDDKAVVHLIKVTADDGQMPQVRTEALKALARRFGMRFRNIPDPRDAAAWNRALGIVRQFPPVRRALGEVPHVNAAGEKP